MNLLNALPCRASFVLRSTLCLALLGAPALSRADGGGPILLLAGIPVFVVGQVWILFAEFLAVLLIVPRLGPGSAFRDVVTINLKSLLFVGIGVPAVASFLLPLLGWLAGGLASALGAPALADLLEGGSLAVALIGANFRSPTYARVIRTGLVPLLCGWFAVTYVLTVWYEARVLSQRWSEREFATSRSPLMVSLVLNTLSYAGLVLTLWLAWPYLD